MQRNLVLIFGSSLVLTACGQASFDPFRPMATDMSPSPSMSSMEISPDNIADGITPATVTIKIQTSNGQPLAGTKMNLEVTGSNNVIVPCTATDANGIARCRIYSTKSESKTARAVGPIHLTAETMFKAPRPSRSAVAFVSAGSVETLPTGQKIKVTAGIMESDSATRDVNGTLRVHSSILGSIVSDEEPL